MPEPWDVVARRALNKSTKLTSELSTTFDGYRYCPTCGRWARAEEHQTHMDDCEYVRAVARARNKAASPKFP